MTYDVSVAYKKLFCFFNFELSNDAVMYNKSTQVLLLRDIQFFTSFCYIDRTSVYDTYIA